MITELTNANQLAQQYIDSILASYEIKDLESFNKYEDDIKERLDNQKKS